MSFDAFTAGIEPGGLRSKDEIKLLICYIISSIKEGISKEDVLKVLQENAFANYFEINSAFSDLIESRNIVLKDPDSSKFIITKSGSIIATQLETSLPASIREHAISSALNLMAKVKLKKENVVDIKKETDGYNVTCHISGGDRDLLAFSVYVPDILQAELIQKNFYENPALTYRYILALATKNRDLIKEILEELSK